MKSSYWLVLNIPSRTYQWKSALELYLCTASSFRRRSNFPPAAPLRFPAPDRLQPPTSAMTALRGSAPSSSMLPERSRQER